MTDDEIIEIVTARKNGERIEKRMWVESKWVEMEKDEGFNFQTYVYRVSKRQKNNLPTSWTEYCETNHTIADYLKVQMPWIGHPAQYGVCSETRYYSAAFVALAKLIMLRDCYNGYTNPLKGSNQYYIDVDIREGKKGVHTFTGNSLCSSRTRCHILHFHTAELRDEFKKNFEDLILQAAKLLI